MAEAIAVISFVSALWALVDYGTKVLQRLNECKASVRDLPQSLSRIRKQLPLLIGTVNNLHSQANAGGLSPETEAALHLVVEGILAQVKGLNSILVKVVPSNTASNWKKGLKAVKSLRYQKTVDDFASVIEGYVSNLTLYQTTYNGDLIKTLINLIEQKSSRRPQEVQVTLRRKPCFMVRHQIDEDFVGREEIMEEILQRFRTTNRVAITGLSGVGKSRIAIEYCYKYKENNPEAQVLWVNGGNRARFEADYWDIARTMQIPGFYHPKINTLQLVSDWLSDKDNGSWLMVLDNADDEELWITPTTQESAQRDSQQQSAPLIYYVPRGSHGYVLITARNRQLGKTLTNVKEKPIDVLPLRPKDAEILLRSKLSEDDEISLEDANDFTKALDYLPLAITQAAAYLDQIDMTFAKYLQLFRASKANTSDLLKRHVYDSGRDRETENSVFQTWRISFDQISKQNPRAAEVLSLMAVLDRHVISEYLLRDDGEPELEFISAIQKLKAFSLVTKETGASSYSMHRLVQDSTQEWLKHEGTIEEWQEKALTAVSKCCPNGGYENWKAWEAINPHVQVVLGYKLHKYLCRLQRAGLLNHCACYDEEKGQYASAHEKAKEAQDIYQDLLGEEDLDTLISMKQVASAQKGLSKYKEAKDTYKRLLKLCGKVLGKDHPLTLACLSDLAITVRHLGDYAEAERMNRVALEGRDNVLGKEHRDTLTSVNNLAEVLKNQGQYQEAEELTRRALEARKKVMGEEHPDTVTSVNDLAEIMTGQGKYSEAEEMHRQALRVREKKLGKEHPVTLISVGNLALVLCHHKRYGEALPIGRRALAVREKVLGKDYAGTLTSAKTLALILQGLRDYNGAEEMIRQCLHGRERLFGTENPSTLTAASILAFILQDQGRYDESETRHRQVLAAREKVLREDHPDIMRSIQGLASVLGYQGKREEAQRINERALEWKEKAQGKRPAE